MTKVIKVNNRQQDPLQLHQENIKKVNKFVYLGSVVSKDKEHTKGEQTTTSNVE